LCPDTPVLADSKTVDGGQLEAEMVLGAGAAFMTVLSSAASASHEAVGRVAAKFGARVIVDTITQAGQKELLPASAAFPESFAYVGVHRPSDAHAAGDSSTAHIEAVAEMHRRGFRVALAGGLGPDSIDSVLRSSRRLLSSAARLPSLQIPKVWRGACGWISRRPSTIAPYLCRPRRRSASLDAR